MRYNSTFLCSHGKIFEWDGSGKFKITRRKGTDKKNSKKLEGKNGGKKTEEIVYIRGGSHIFGVLHQSGTPLGSHPHATLLQENPLLWEPPLQHNTYQLLNFILYDRFSSVIMALEII